MRKIARLTRNAEGRGVLAIEGVSPSVSIDPLPEPAGAPGSDGPLLAFGNDALSGWYLTYGWHRSPGGGYTAPVTDDLNDREVWD